MFNTVVVHDESAAVQNAVPKAQQMSATALDSVKRGICCGLVKSLVYYLYNNEASRDEARKKVLTFVNAMRSNGDISEYEGDYISDSYFSTLVSMCYAVDVNCEAPVCSSSYLNWYTIISNLIEDTHTWAYSFDTELMNKLNEHEQALVTGLREASDAYYKARNEFEDYFREANKKALSMLLVKYGTTFSQIAPEWYKSICNACGITKNNEDPRA